MYRFLLFKNFIENIILSPLIFIGQILAKLFPLKYEYDVFFIFPFYHTGGAEYVHSKLIYAINPGKALIFFTRKSISTTHFEDFKKSGHTIKDISKYTDNKFLYFFNFFYRGLISGYINSQKKKPVVFNGQSNFGYKISPWVKRNIFQIELIHALNSFSRIRIPFVRFYKTTVTVSQEIIDLHYSYYSKHNIKVPLHSYEIIESRIELPETQVKKSYFEEKLNILYVGRGTEEKRVHLVAKIAKKVIDQNLPCEFLFAGDVFSSVPNDLKKYCTLLGNLNIELLQEVYNKAHILIIASKTESGPLVLMEGMCFGLVILSTPVGIVKNHLKEDVNGYLLDLHNEELIITKATNQIKYLLSNRLMLNEMGETNRQYANKNFGMKDFIKNYRLLFNHCLNAKRN